MAMRSVLSRGRLFGLMEGNLRSSASSLRCMSDGRILGEEERAQETVYIKVFINAFFFFLILGRFCCFVFGVMINFARVRCE